MEAMILDTNFQGIYIVDSFESFIWTDRFSECGDFELYIPIDGENTSPSNFYSRYPFFKNYYVWTSRSKHLMIVESVSIDADAENGNKIKVSGRSLESILDRRIIWKKLNFVSECIQDVIYKLLYDNVMYTGDQLRTIPNFIFKTNMDQRLLDIKITAQYFGENLYDTIKSLCEENGIGFQIVLNDDLKFEFSLLVGTDRSYNNAEQNPYVVFSPSFDNLLSSSYVTSNTNYKNYALVVGEDIGKNTDEKKTTKVCNIDTTNADPLNIREVFVESSSTSTYQESDTEVTMSNSDYLNLLAYEGLTELSQNKEETAFEGSMASPLEQTFVYGTDFFIGDIVQIENEYSIQSKVYVSEAIMSQDSSGFTMYPTFKEIT